MTSQLNVDTIVDKAGSGGTNVKMGNTSTYVSDGGSATQNTVQGLIKAWIMQEDGTTVHDSFNQASLTDNGTGDYRVTLTNNMNNALFAVLQQMNPYTFTAGSKTVLNGCRANHSDGQATTYYGQKCGQVAIGSHGSAQDAESAAGISGDLA
jgi:hypothetical protein